MLQLLGQSIGPRASLLCVGHISARHENTIRARSISRVLMSLARLEWTETDLLQTSSNTQVQHAAASTLDGRHGESAATETSIGSVPVPTRSLQSLSSVLAVRDI